MVYNIEIILTKHNLTIISLNLFKKKINCEICNYIKQINGWFKLFKDSSFNRGDDSIEQDS